MLQRAASNAYSWWWASHIRTKQSKWLEQSLQDMEEKVGVVLKLIQEDGDSFRKKAEMYYKKRPELISFVEESYRAFRALAERYDHISKELQNANHTIATVFPDQVPFEMDDDDDDDGGGSPRIRKKQPDSKQNIPKVPNAPMDDIKGLINTATKKLKPKKPGAGAKNMVTKRVLKSGLSKEEGVDDIDKKQKRILALQTEKEFVKSSYEGQLAKYWEIDQEIREMQDKVYHLQDEFGPGNVIEDDEARNVMATAALRSCSETLKEVEEKQEKTAKEAKAEQKRIKQTRKKLNTLKDGFCVDKEASAESKAKQEAESSDEDMAESESLKEKSEEQFSVEQGGSLSVAQMAGRIDELVNKVVRLETTAALQTVLTQSLGAETDELQAQIQTLEDDKNTLVDDKNNLRKKLRELEERYKELQDLNQRLEEEKTNLQATSAEALCKISELSEKLPTEKPDEGNNSIVDANTDLSEKLTEMEERCKKLQDQNQRLENTNLRAPSIKADCNISQPSEKLHTEKPDEENNTLVDANKDLSKKLREMEERRKELQDQNQRLEEQNANLRAPSTAANCNISQVSEKQHTEKPDEESEFPVKSIEKLGAITSSGLRSLYSDKKRLEQEISSVNTDPKKLQTVNPEEKLQNTGSPQEKIHMTETRSADGVSVPPPEKEKSLVQHGSFAAPQKETDTVNIYNGSKMTKSVEQEVRVDSKHDLTSDNRASSRMTNTHSTVESQGQVTAADRDEPDWQQLYKKGMDDKEKNILLEYTNVLRNYKQMKKTLAEAEAKNQNRLFEVALQLRDLRNANALKDDEIRSLLQRLNLLQINEQGVSAAPRLDTDEPATTEDKDDIRLMAAVHQHTMSPIEAKFRMEIDEVLEGNLNFWMRFSTTFSEIQKYETEVKDLQAEASKLLGKKKHEGSSTEKYSLKSDVRPTYKYLKEINTEISVWREKCQLLKKEVKIRFSSLCEIQEDITKALKQSAEDDDFTFTSYQAAKFQGEILNMKQENNKVADELQTGLDHAVALQLDVEKTLTGLCNEFGLEGAKQRPQLEHTVSRSRVPLRSFIFDAKPKKPKSIFSVVHPALYRKNHPFRLALNRL